MMPTRPLVILALASVLLIETSAAMARESFLARMECPIVGNLAQCAETHAQEFFRLYPTVVQRTSAGLRVRLDSGRSVNLRRECAECLDPIAIHQPSRLLLVREQFSEGNTWWMINLKSGRSVETKGWPLFSPSGQYVFAYSGMDESAYTAPIARLYDVSGELPILVWRGLTMSRAQERWIHKWGPRNPKWRSDRELIFEVEEWQSNRNGGGEFVVTGLSVLRFVDGKWEHARRRN